MLNYNRIAYELDTLGTPSEQHGGDTPQATQYTNITMLQHFDYPESIAYEGNAGLSNVAKFGKACAHFRDSNSYVSLTNTTGVFNLSANGSAEAECFVKTAQGSGSGYNSNLTEFLEADLLSAGYSVYNGHVFKLYTTGKTWTDADSYCKSLGGHLVSVTSEEKRDFLGTILSGGGEAWTCGYYENGIVTWLNGDTSDYVDWHTGHPDGNGPYIQLYNSNNTTPYHFDDIAPGYIRNFICEWDSLDSVIPSFLKDNGYKFYNGHTFKLFTTGKTWAETKNACEALGGHVATSTSAEKNAFLVTVANGSNIRLGGTDEETEGVWQWVTGEEWNYTNWNSGEPGNSGAMGEENCLTMVCDGSHTTGVWIDQTHLYEIPYICEWDSLDSVISALLQDIGYKFYNGHTFKVLSTEYDLWDDAKAACEALGGHLATITSAEKQSFIETITANVRVNCWLGGQKDNEGWGWITGETWSYTNWYTGYPANIGDYLKLFTNSGNKWANDDGIDTRSLAICEWDEDLRESGSNGVSSGNILSLSDNSNVVSTSDAETQGYKFYNGHTFKYYSDTKIWAQAKALCESLGGHLATSTSAEKNTFLTTLTTDTAWLGGTDEAEEGVWQWITGAEWSYTNWASGEPSNYGNGKAQHYLVTNHSSTGLWDDAEYTTTHGYICEWDYDIREPRTLTLSIANDGALNLQSAIWGLDETSALTLEPDTWYHVLLRLSEGTASVYLDGAQALSGNVSGSDITPQSLTLGGYVGYMDEFVFRDGAGTGAPVVPTSAYETGAGLAPTSSNAPVTRAVWTCEDLPEGLTLSSSGVLSGHPTTAGTYDCDVSVATNWGTATKTIRIVVNNV